MFFINISTYVEIALGSLDLAFFDIIIVEWGGLYDERKRIKTKNKHSIGTYT